MAEIEKDQIEQDSDFDDQVDVQAGVNSSEGANVKDKDVGDVDDVDLHPYEQAQGMDYPAWVDTFQRWLGEGNAQDVRNIMDFFDRSHARWEAVKELTTDEFAQKSQYLKRDLMMFFNHYQADMAESEFVQAVKESAWYELAEMTDKSQIEWQELVQDFRHEGVYEQGEWVGMGVIVCKNCHYKMTFVHPEQLSACPECKHGRFLREALAP